MNADEATTTTNNPIDADVEYAQGEAHEAVSALEVEIIGAIERLAGLYKRVAELHTQIETLNRGDIDGADAETLFGIGLLQPLPEDTEADIVGIVIDQGAMDEGGETCSGKPGVGRRMHASSLLQS